MPQYGVLPTGFARKPVFAILAEIEASQREDISASLNLSSSTPWGQNNGIFANELGIAWEILEVCYHAFDPDAAQDFLATSLAKLTGTLRRSESYSLVTLECELDEAATLESGVHFAAVDGDTTNQWTPVEDFTAPSTGTHEVLFRAENTGPVRAESGTITVRNTSVAGWHSVNNPEAAQVGRVADSDATLRSRREAQLTSIGSATVDAIRADVLKLENVETCRVFGNDTDETVDGMPPHSVEVLVFDGEIPAADDDEIAQAIWNNKTGGIETIGTTQGTAVDSRGQERIVRFSRPALLPVYIEIEIEKSSALAYTDAGGDTALANFLAAELKAMHGVGDSVRWRRADSVAFRFGDAIEDVTAFRLGLAPAPTGTENIEVPLRSLATFDASRITVIS